MTTVNATKSGASVLWLGTLLMSACGGEAIEDSGETASLGVNTEAATAFGLSKWSRRPMPAKFCTKLDNSKATNQNFKLSLDTYNTIRWWVIDALQETWAQAPGVTFVDMGTCLEGSLDITIALTAADPTAPYDDRNGRCGYGTGQCTVWAYDGDFSEDSLTKIKAIVVHEVGHGLGLIHEHQMPGGSPCATVTVQLAACISCQDGTCPPSDYDNCLHPDVPSTANPMHLDSGEIAYAKDKVANLSPDTSARPLTPYDGLSVMDYCAGENGRDPTDYMPTRLDLLGMEMLYPDNRSYPVGCGTACLYSSDGVIVRTGSTVTSDWTARGGVGIKLVGGATSFTIPPGIDGDGTVSLNFVDPRGTTRVASRPMHKSAGLYAAVVLASTAVR
jgi:hypothetical protein